MQWVFKCYVKLYFRGKEEGQSYIYAVGRSYSGWFMLNNVVLFSQGGNIRDADGVCMMLIK